MIHVYHHNDADGRLSAAIAALSYNVRDRQAVVFHECAYGPAPSFDGIQLGDDVWVVDYSFKDPDFERLTQACGVQAVMWIDHHATCRDSRFLQLPGTRSFIDKGPAACQLTWEFCFPGTAVPEIVTLVGDYDSWAMQHSPDCRRFYEAVKGDQELQSPEGWLKLLQLSSDLQDEWVSRVVAEGRAIIAYRDGYLAGLRKTFGYRACLTDLRWGVMMGNDVPALNVQQFGSAAFTPEQLRDNPFCIAYCHDGQEFTVSLYSENTGAVDCGAIAKAFGGGGHRGAAGFKCAALPWTLSIKALAIPA